jgi:hypothetical protein
MTRLPVHALSPKTLRRAFTQILESMEEARRKRKKAKRSKK